MSYPSPSPPPEQKPKAKLCNNGCGTWIYWVASMRYFAEANNDERHICPNYGGGNKQQQAPPPLQQQQKFQQQPTEHFTLEQIHALNKINDNIDLSNQYMRVIVNTVTQMLEELQRLYLKECNCSCGAGSAISETASITTNYSPLQTDDTQQEGLSEKK